MNLLCPNCQKMLTVPEQYAGQLMKCPLCSGNFTVPALPLVSILGILVCGAMIYGLGWTNWLRLGVWLIIGLCIYFGYSARHSKLRGSSR